MTKADRSTITSPAATAERRAVQPHEILLSPTVQGAAGLKAWGKFAGDVDLVELVEGLRARVKIVQDGDMRPVEAMLFSQAVTLETVFTSLAQRAALNAGEYIGATDTYMRLALRAQAQCRATLEALAEIKNPRPVAFVKQANISGGHQQVNNGVQPTQRAGSAQGGGGVASVPAPETETARSYTRTIYSPGAAIQTAGSTTRVA
jgi:hypothetical protein